MDTFAASEARLRNENAWEPLRSDKNAHITINLGELVLVSGVATQGINEDEFSGRITRYKVRYSYDGQAWYNYTYLNNSDKASCKPFYSHLSSRKISFHIRLFLQDLHLLCIGFDKPACNVVYNSIYQLRQPVKCLSLRHLTG